MKVSAIKLSVLLKWISAAIVIASMTGCPNPMAVKDEINSQFYEIRPGSKWILHQDISISSGRAHASFQHGQVTDGLDNYAVGCVLEVRDLGPGTVTAGTFTIRRAENSTQWINRPDTMEFYRIMYLESESQPGVMHLTCKDWDGPLQGKDITVPEMREALGGIASFVFVQEGNSN